MNTVQVLQSSTPVQGGCGMAEAKTILPNLQTLRGLRGSNRNQMQHHVGVDVGYKSDTAALCWRQLPS